MSQQATSILSLTYLASGAVAQYRGVLFTGAQCAAAGAKILGISEKPAASGEYSSAISYGTAVCEAGAAIAVGAALAMDASGRVITATAVTITTGATAVTSSAANGAGTITGGDLPQFIVGHALQAASAAGDLIEVLLSR